MKVYTGLKLPRTLAEQGYTHLPLIKIVPLDISTEDYFRKATHFIFTSQTAVSLFCEGRTLSDKVCISVGKSTTAALEKYGAKIIYTSSDERAEGVIELLQQFMDRDFTFVWPHSVQSRSLISDFLSRSHSHFYDVSLYDVAVNDDQPLPALEVIDEAYFTSPSTVDAFLKIYGTLPPIAHAIGPVTQLSVDNFSNKVRFN